MESRLRCGEDIHRERVPHRREGYDTADANAVFRVSEGVGHAPEPALDDLVEFHARSLNGDGIEPIRDDLSGGD